MWTTVLETTAIYTAANVLTHHASKNLLWDVFENPGMMNFTAAFVNSTIPVNALNYTGEGAFGNEVTDRLRFEKDRTKKSNGTSGLPFRVTITNGTALNETISAAKEQKEPFYTKELPLGVFAHFVMCTLQYVWLIWLERVLPARSRRRDVIVKEKGEMSEDREEEVVKKWIAQGRVRRASLNWCNTLLKWVLSLTVGRVWWFAVLHIVRRSLRLESPRKIREDMLGVVAMSFAGSFISITPLAELIAFVAIPAYKQTVFVAGADLAFHIFFVTVVRKLASWAVQTEFAQGLMQNVTKSVVDGRNEAERYAKFKNEL
ncbi:uncharacterized protein N0V89_000754 [Didymosphaeria variabile]|uniref:Uncharacterized protein n=1 Tax=Didymosphaeria variabile TaxID=1932322 RepID=A0A9W8XY11_9PLEO|nr:uncharacterized protein N0V89_000754 [Didymosphaeria variabile]KAJ4360194.1 hypothetical protein N0V89_000754 [Didymosphaeria variabile]